MADSIVIFYSRAGQNYAGGSIRYLDKGNTEIAAEMIAERTGADVFRIEPVKAYSENYSECIDEALHDKNRGARPELRKYPGDLSSYSTVYLGYPNYWGTMPMVMFTFLEQADLTGITVMPFCTNEGSGMGSSEADIRKLCPGCILKTGLSIKGCRVSASGSLIGQWISVR